MARLFSDILRVIIFLVASLGSVAAQSIERFPHGLGFELGGGQNDLYWSGNGPTGPFGWIAMTRTDILFAPNARITYQRPISGDLFVLPFLGYTRVGGINKSEGGSQFTFQVLEAGAMVLFNVSNFFVGAGLKEKLNLSVLYDASDGRIHVDYTPIFPSWSSNAGLRVSYQIVPVTFSLEGWFGTSNLLDPPMWSVRENHYRFFVGYTL